MIIFKNFQILRIFDFFFFWKFLLDLQANFARFFDMSKFVEIFVCHMSEHQNFYWRQCFDAWSAKILFGTYFWLSSMKK